MNPPEGIDYLDWIKLNGAEKVVCRANRLARIVSLAAAADAVIFAEISSGTGPAFDNVHDAYRHALWSANLTSYAGATLAEQFTNAHESDQAPHESVCMDKQNNRIGRTIAAQVGGIYSFNSQALENAVIGWPRTADPELASQHGWLQTAPGCP